MSSQAIVRHPAAWRFFDVLAAVSAVSFLLLGAWIPFLFAGWALWILQDRPRRDVVLILSVVVSYSLVVCMLLLSPRGIQSSTEEVFWGDLWWLTALGFALQFVAKWRAAKCNRAPTIWGVARETWSRWTNY